MKDKTKDIKQEQDFVAERQNKFKLGPISFGHSKITHKGTGDTYELWNELDIFERRSVPRKLGLPAGILPIGPNGKLILGEGAGGRVRLAKMGNEFFAVKKMKVEKGKELGSQSSYREYLFGQAMQDYGIPNVMLPKAILKAPSSQPNEEKFYQVMPLVTLGDGYNLKHLTNKLEPEERNKVIKYVAHQILMACEKMHEKRIYHRDIKASNFLINHNGNIYLSDFGGGYISAYQYDERKKPIPLEVSDQTDLRYFSPEYWILVETSEGEKGLNYSQNYDEWRLGLTLLQFYGCAKEGRGILCPPYGLIEWYRSQSPSTELIKAYKEKIKHHYATELENITQGKRFKDIPQDMQKLILGFLAINPRERMSTTHALKLLEDAPSIDAVYGVFETMTRYQVSQAVITGIKNVLLRELYKSPFKGYQRKVPPLTPTAVQEKNNELWKKYRNKLDKFTAMIRNPELSLHDLNHFLSIALQDKAIKLDEEQFNAVRAMTRLQFLKQNNIKKEDFTEKTIKEIKGRVEKAVKEIQGNVYPVENADALGKLFQEMTNFNYLSTSLDYFYPTDKDFKKNQALLKKVNIKFNKKMHDVFNLLKNKMEAFKEKTIYQIPFEEVDTLSKTIATCMPLFDRVGIEEKKVQELKELLRILERRKEEFLAERNYENKKTNYQGVPAPTTKERQLDQNSHYEKVQPPVENKRQNETIEASSSNTQLKYVKEATNIRYKREANYLENAPKNENEHIQEHGFTNEEKKFIEKMVSDFLTGNRKCINIRGDNPKFVTFAANYLSHLAKEKNTEVKIFVNGQRYQMARTPESEKPTEQTSFKP